MPNLNITEIKAFIPAKDFELSKKFYEDIGFTKASDGNGIAHFHFDDCSFLLQDFYEPEHCNNFMMHILVEDIEAWHSKIEASGVAEKYTVKISQVSEQPWGMLDFVMHDPSCALGKKFD